MEYKSNNGESSDGISFLYRDETLSGRFDAR